MFKTITTGLVIALMINLVSLNMYNLYIQQEFEGQVTTTNYLNNKITEVKSNLLEMRADSISSVSRSEFDNTIEDSKRFIEYEVSMSKKSIQEFIDSLNKDMDRLNTISNLSQKNDEYFQEQLELILYELKNLQTPEVIDTPVIEPETIEPAVVEKEEEVVEPVVIEECSYALQKGRQNSTKGIQRTVDNLRKKGNYNLSVLFNINTQGIAEDLSVQSNAAPSKLEKAVQKYVSRLNFIPKDTVVTDCEMSFNLNVT
tara:strand:- start:1547 stop:2317 length:771 start_codon:yes stop_codon:yes gene_type:complete